MHQLTTNHLENVYKNQSVTRMQYIVWAERAENEGRPEAAKIFRAIANKQKGHDTACCLGVKSRRKMPFGSFKNRTNVHVVSIW